MRACAILPLLFGSATADVKAFGPVTGAATTHPDAGWVVDNAIDALPTVDSDGTLTITGDSRVYLVQDYNGKSWGEHKYVRIDMAKDALRFTLDLSNVPCGCLACIYLVSMKDPNDFESSYCDMAENVRPGFEEGMCTELDILEANNWAMQTAIHTELGGTYGSGNCDRNGCFARVGGPQSPAELQVSYSLTSSARGQHVGSRVAVARASGRTRQARTRVVDGVLPLLHAGLVWAS